MKIEADILQYSSELKISKIEDKKSIFCLIRKKWLVLTPEEMVRQLFILFLTKDLNYNNNKIQVEKGIKVGGTERRFDILIYNEAFEPIILIECKRPKIKLDQKVFEQTSLYNIQLKVPYLIATNGMEHYCCQVDFETKEFVFLEAFPEN